MELTGPKLCKTVKFWHASAKEILIDAGNHTRPTNCVVGEFLLAHSKQSL